MLKKNREGKNFYLSLTHLLKDILIMKRPVNIKKPAITAGNTTKKKAFEKYLNGELDNKSLNDILSTFENKKHQEKNNKDVAYS